MNTITEAEFNVTLVIWYAISVGCWLHGFTQGQIKENKQTRKILAHWKATLDDWQECIERDRIRDQKFFYELKRRLGYEPVKPGIIKEIDEQ